MALRILGPQLEILSLTEGRSQLERGAVLPWPYGCIEE